MNEPKPKTLKLKSLTWADARREACEIVRGCEHVPLSCANSIECPYCNGSAQVCDVGEAGKPRFVLMGSLATTRRECRP